MYHFYWIYKFMKAIVPFIDEYLCLWTKKYKMNGMVKVTKK